MKDKKILISIICVFVALTVLILLLAFLLPRKKTPITLTLSCSDITVTINESQDIRYQANLPVSDIIFSVEDDSIAVVEGNSIRGVAIGETKLTIIATSGEMTTKKEVMVIVEGSKLRFDLKPMQNCESDGLTLFYTENSTFSFTVYGENQKPLIDPIYQITAENISYTTEFGNIILRSQNDGYITFNFFEHRFTVTIKLVYKETI